MSRYRWLRPLKCLETMEFFPAIKGLSYEATRKLLFDAVARGDVQALLNNEIVPKAHIGVYLALYTRASPEQDRNTLPPDITLNYDDLCAVFDRPKIDNTSGADLEGKALGGRKTGNLPLKCIR